MPKRFKSLDAALKYLRPPGLTSGTSSVNAPTGSQLGEYQDFKSGKKIVTYDRAASSRPGNLGEAYVKPFGLAAADTKIFIVDYSSRARSAQDTTGLTDGLLGIVAKTDDTVRTYGFTPARATVVLIPIGDGTPTPSKITGKTYKKKKNDSYTFPMGRTGANPSYVEQKNAITLAVSQGNTNRGVSFKPEIYR
jgi:hypothetical protein